MAPRSASTSPTRTRNWRPNTCAPSSPLHAPCPRHCSPGAPAVEQEGKESGESLLKISPDLLRHWSRVLLLLNRRGRSPGETLANSPDLLSCEEDKSPLTIRFPSPAASARAGPACSLRVNW